MEKINKKLSKIIGVALFLAIFTSCEKILDQKPLSILTVENFYSNEVEAQTAVNAIYGVFTEQDTYKRFGASSLILMEDWIYKPVPPNVGVGLSEINEFNILPDNPILYGWYNQMYIGINRANVAIQRISLIPSQNITEASRKRLLAEAKAMRAFCYYYLVRLFGSVPLVTEPATDPESAGITAAPENEVWGQIEKDFSEAIADLPVQQTGVNYGRISGSGARSLLAQVYLWQNKYAQAIPLLDQVINTGGFQLNSDYLDNFLESKEGNKEMVHVIAFKDIGLGAFSGDNRGNLWIRDVGVRGTGNNINAPGTQAGFGYVLTFKELAGKYERGDKRRDINLWEPGKLSPQTNRAFNPLANGTFGRNSTDLGVMKWWWNNRGYSNTTGPDMPIIRYADVLLMLAEAVSQSESPNAKAYGAINQVRKRAGLPDLTPGLSKDAFLEKVLNERHVEFMFELNRWWDLARTKTAEKAFRGDALKAAFSSSKHYKWPLPQAALERNKSLKQNPAYN